MKSKMKLPGLLMAALLVASAALADKKMDDLFDSVIVKGKGFEIKRSQLDQAVDGVKATALAQGQEIPASDTPILERRLMDRLIQIQLLNSKATAAEKAKSKEEGETRFNEIKKRAPNDDALARQLKAMGMSVEQLRARLIEEATAETVLFGKVTISDEQVKRFYEENPTQFEVPEAVHVSHILMLTADGNTGMPLSEDERKARKTKMEGVLKRARGGEDFSKLIKQYSEDPSVKDNGGEATFSRDGVWAIGRVPPEVEAAAFSMKTNQVSDIVTSMLGYHIIKLQEKVPAHRVELAKVSTRIKDYLQGREVEKMMPAYYAQLKREANVEILDPRLKAMEEAAQKDANIEAPIAKPSGAGK